MTSLSLSSSHCYNRFCHRHYYYCWRYYYSYYDDTKRRYSSTKRILSSSSSSSLWPPRQTNTTKSASTSSYDAIRHQLSTSLRSYDLFPLREVTTTTMRRMSTTMIRMMSTSAASLSSSLHSPMGQPHYIPTKAGGDQSPLRHDPFWRDPDSTAIPTAREVEIVGNIFHTPTTREKLAEMKVEMLADDKNNKEGKLTLDDLATNAQQRSDLWFLDGIIAITKSMDQSRINIPPRAATTTTTTNPDGTSTDPTVEENMIASHHEEWKLLYEVSKMIELEKEKIMKQEPNDDRNSHHTMIDQIQYEEYLRNIQSNIGRMIMSIPSDRCYQYIRDYYDPDHQDARNTNTTTTTDSNTATTTTNDPSSSTTTSSSSSSKRPPDYDTIIQLFPYHHEQKKWNDIIQQYYSDAIIRSRLLQTLSVIQYLLQKPDASITGTLKSITKNSSAPEQSPQDTWKQITTYTNAEKDRHATKQQQQQQHHDDGGGIAVPDGVDHISLEALHHVLQSYVVGNASDRFQAMWSLYDIDHDTLLEEETCTYVCNDIIIPMSHSMQTLLQEALAAASSSTTAPYDVTTSSTTTTTSPVRRISRYQKRLERNAKKNIMNLYNNKVRHPYYSHEYEIYHRIRCCYAWANKEHQKNRIETVLIDAGISSIASRQRYVELKPQISHQEFLEVQNIHLIQMDRIATEYISCLRDEILLQQGQSRRRTRLLKDCTSFMIGLCLIDYIIYVI